MPGSGLSAGAVPVPRRERMAAACRCSRCAAWQPERRRPPRSFSFGIICESCYATARKENIRGYVRYRSPSVPTSALARRGRAVFPQRSLPRRPSTARCSQSGGAPRTSARLSPQQRPRGAPRRFFTAQPRAASQRSAAAVPPRCSPPLPPFGPEQTSPRLFLKIFGNLLLCARCKNVKRFGEFFLPGFTLFSLRAIKRCGNR